MTKKCRINDNCDDLANLPVTTIKEENGEGVSFVDNEYMAAKGRLKGALKLLTEKSEDSESSEDLRSPKRRRLFRGEDAPPYRHTYVMKLFDRSVDLARFEEDTPLYPICRAWMQNQPRVTAAATNSISPKAVPANHGSSVLSSPCTSTSSVVRGSTASTNENNMAMIVTALPPPSGPILTRIPSPLPEQLAQDKTNICLDYELVPPTPKDTLIRQHLQRWTRVKRKWVATALTNEERYKHSLDLLDGMHNKDEKDTLELNSL